MQWLFSWVRICHPNTRKDFTIDAADTLYTADRLASQLALPDGAEPFSALLGQPYVLADLAEAGAAEIAALTPALSQLPCPVIAVGELANGSAPLVDTAVPDLKAARVLTDNIRSFPRSAMTLVQVLRHNEHASVHEGLLMESLAYATLQGGEEFRRFLADKKPPPAPRHYTEPAVLCEREGDQLRLTLNRPDKRNAFSAAMREGLVEALQLLQQDPAIAKAQIRGAGECFCVGGDLDEFGQFPDIATGHAIRSTRNAGRLISQMATRIECHVHRACIGAGIELPAFCHRVVAEPATYFQLPEIKLGLVPGAGGTVSILQRIGRHRSTWMGLSGKRVNAKTALTWGLIDAIA